MANPESARVRLRPFVAADAAFVRALVADREFVRFVGDRGIASDEDAVRYVEETLRPAYEAGGLGLRVIERLEDRAPLGTAGLVDREGVDGLDLGFALLPEARGRGYAVEGARLALDHARHVLGLDRVAALASPDNVASHRVLERLGFAREGTVRLREGDEELAHFTLRLVDLRERLRRRDPLVLDGGLATELEARGHDLDDPLWSARVLLDEPEAVRAVHSAFVEAGAECVIAATYQASFPALERRGLAREAATDLLHEAVRLARRSGATFVAASVGPYGAALADGSEYTGDYPGTDEASLRAWHEERFDALARSGADALACETIPSGAEARALLDLAAGRAEVPVWLSLSCRAGAKLRDGTPVREVARAAAGNPGLAALGVNCSAPDHVAAVLEALGEETALPLVAYPNSGELYDAATGAWSGENEAARFGRLAVDWRRRGARAIGGCCRTRPEHVRSIAAALAGRGR